MSEQTAPSNVVRKQGRKVQFFDGNGVTLVPTLVQDVITYAVEGATVNEARHRDQHLAGAPIVIRGADGNITGSMSLLIASEAPTGSAAGDQLLPSYWLYEERCAGAGLVTTGRTPVSVGGAMMIGIRVYDEASNSTATLRYCRIEKPTQSMQNDMLLLTFNFTDYESDVTITNGDATQ